MAEKVFDSIERVYDRHSIPDCFFPKKQKSHKFLFWKWTTEHTDRKSINGISQAKVNYATHIIDTVSRLFGKKLRIKVEGFQGKDLVSIVEDLNSQAGKLPYTCIGKNTYGTFFGLAQVSRPAYRASNFLFDIIDENSEKLGTINFCVGIDRCDSYTGPYLDEKGGIMLIIDGKNIRSNSQFLELEKSF
jgi:hypothetical protein